MPGHVTIRRLRIEDGAAVRALDGLILGPDRSATWDRYVERFFAVSDLDVLILPPWGCHVAEEEGQIVGFILAERQTRGYGLPPGARIVAVAVHPDRRRSGIGRMLIDALKAECAGEDLHEVYAILRNEDGRDQAFLRACGFVDSRIRVLSTEV